MYVIIDARRAEPKAQTDSRSPQEMQNVCKIAQIVYGYFLAIAMACFAYIFHGS
jgi:hypothetical protein